MRRWIPALSLLLAGCSSGPVFPEGHLPPGSWGGEHLLMSVADSGATLEFDCAAGFIPGPLVVRDDGEFTWSGSFTPGLGGPVRQDEVRPAYPASYRGDTDGRRMVVRLVLPDSLKIAPQEYELHRGQSARVFKCL